MEKRFRISMRTWSVSLIALVCLVAAGCVAESGEKTSSHEHHVPEHWPTSLWDLSQKIRSRLAEMKAAPQDERVRSELIDLIGWSAEIAADTNIGEQKWIPIYELSEGIRKWSDRDPSQWDTERRDQAIRLCQLIEDAWRSLDPSDQVDLYVIPEDDHDHDEHDDHDHDEHDDHDEGEHDDHDEGDHGQGHSSDEGDGDRSEAG